MSSGMTFLLWLAWVAGGVSIVVLLVLLSNHFFLKRMLSLLRTLRCPECGGEYDGTTIARLAPAHALKPPPSPPPPVPPPRWQVSCSACRIVAVYTEQGQLQRTYSPAPSLPEAA
ncbi:hypothetical protein ACLESO_45740 [Pyxidicoccus sp. 3LG]